MVIADQIAQPSPTREIAEWVASGTPPPPVALTWARHAILDWLGVTIAGAREPLAAMLREELAGGGPCTLLGCGARANAHHAALINGAAGHALDYDDVSREMYGHPTAPVAPALLALAEVTGATGAAVLEALAVGIEVESAIGEMTRGGHYNLGFHATGTIGAFGAAAGCARLLRLDSDATARALGLAASMAAGLKVNFGTMAKPFHAGTAAANGLLAARLAARGFTASPDAIEAPQGFLATQGPDSVIEPVRPDAQAPWWVERTLFKYHAACYSTHATIEAVNHLRRTHGIGLDDMAAITLTVHPRHLKVCNIPEPETGLQMKFSLRQLAVAALDGLDTGALETFSAANACDARYAAARQRVTVETDPGRDRMTARVAIALTDGRRVEAEADVGQPAADLNAQWDRLAAKFASVAAPVIGEVRAAEAITLVAGLDGAVGVAPLMRTAR
ncbi:MAG TPA: MmgE/PrpD family protein [Thermohalobaculum sp.]|nr:MmgE/PrpD family protein [Thermohalobaculum sp.]